jgi:hypothetical protein
MWLLNNLADQRHLDGRILSIWSWEMFAVYSRDIFWVEIYLIRTHSSKYDINTLWKKSRRLIRDIFKLVILDLLLGRQ